MVCTPTPRTALSAASTLPCSVGAMERATQLLLDIAGGSAGPVIEVVTRITSPNAHL